ncbi:hypothetical protein BGX38DRAFT_1138373 [Terfezia claveryi]|nr:hypothetical protein BGX38DRAFT_1138373 [Terfezia claveryi]
MYKYRVHTEYLRRSTGTELWCGNELIRNVERSRTPLLRISPTAPRTFASIRVDRTDVGISDATGQSSKTIWKDLAYVKDFPAPLRTSEDLPKPTSTNEIGTSVVGEAVGDTEVAGEQPIPWYLKDTYATRSSLVPERAPLPPLPDNSPELLGEILEQLDAELGVTDMNIMDLRPLDPAPAIGRDIIMIFGNTRSERHLHNTANKICRWLRSAHGIRPYADGLIGRNAQKLINRRRIRRGKVTASQSGEVNEYVATEWVCVNTGYEGIILQLFTPKRRGELNLEALWERKLDTNKKNMEKLGSGTGLQERYENDGEEVLNNLVEEMKVEEIEQSYIGTEPNPFRLSFPVRGVSSFPSRPTRALHTSRRLNSLETTTHKSVTPTYRKLPSTYQEFMHKVPLISADIQNGAYSTIERSFNTYYPGRSFSPSMKQAGILFAHVHHLQNIPSDVAAEALGITAFDTTSTPFLRSFFQEMPTAPGHIHYYAWLSLLIQGHIIKPTTYPESCFQKLLIQIKATGANVPLPFYTTVLETLATTPELRKIPESSSAYATTRETTRRMSVMVRILTDMSRSSANFVNTPEIYTLIIRGLMSKDIEGIYRLAMEVCEIPDAAKRNRRALQNTRERYLPDRRIFLIERLMDQYKIKQDRPEWYINFLTAAAVASYWPAFWNRWNDVHYQSASRGREMYKLVLGLVSMSENQNEAVNTLRNLKYSMGREMPRVTLDVELARGFLAVMDVAEGGAGRGVIGVEYRTLKRQCERLLV